MEDQSQLRLKLWIESYLSRQIFEAVDKNGISEEEQKKKEQRI